jgi:hypothetical protein
MFICFTRIMNLLDFKTQDKSFPDYGVPTLHCIQLLTEAWVSPGARATWGNPCFAHRTRHMDRIKYERPPPSDLPT